MPFCIVVAGLDDVVRSQHSGRLRPALASTYSATVFGALSEDERWSDFVDPRSDGAKSCTVLVRELARRERDADMSGSPNARSRR